MVLKIRFVSDEEKYCIFLGVHFNFVHPKLDNTIERCDIRDIKYKENPLAASIIGACDRSESLLSSSIPDLELDAFIIDGEGFESKIDSDGSKIMFRKLILYEPDEYSRFSDARVSNDDSFEKVVVLFDHSL